MFGLFKKRDRNITDADAGGTVRMLLVVSDLGWQARLVDPADPDKVDVRGGEALGLTQTGEARYEAILRMVAEGLPARDQRAIGRVDLLLDDAAAFYSDTRAPLFTAASAASLRDFGAQQLNCAKVTYGQAAFGSTSAGPRDNGVIGFFDTKRLGHCLTRLDKLALRVRSVTPLADLLVRRANAGSQPYGGLYLGGSHTLLVLANPLHGSVVARSIPIGLTTLANRLAEGNGITVEEAMRSLASRDLLSEMSLGHDGGGGDVLAQSASDRILGKTLRRLAEEIGVTLDFFQNQRVSPLPPALELFGEVGRAKGLAELLAASLPVPTVEQPQSLLDSFLAVPPGGCLNMLQHSGSELRIGAMAYGFRNEKLTPATAIARDEAVGRSDLARQQIHSKGRSGSRAKPGSRGRRGNPAPAAGGSLSLSGLIARLNGSAPDGMVGGVAGDVENRKQEQQFLLLLGLIAGGVLYIGYQQIDGSQTLQTQRTASIAATLSTVAKARQDIGGDFDQHKRSGETDKVLWTEKFLLLSKAMNDKMWLTDLFLTSENRTVSGASVETKKLVLEGAVLPSTDGHILEIARYIDKLQTIDNGAFMVDFRQITFQGATLDQSGRDPVVRFGIEAWYDSNKRLETQRAAADPTDITATGAVNQVEQARRAQQQEIERAQRR